MSGLNVYSNELYPKYNFNINNALTIINRIKTKNELIKNNTMSLNKITKADFSYVDSSIDIIKEFVIFCKENNCNEIYWLFGNVFYRKLDVLNLKTDDNKKND